MPDTLQFERGDQVIHPRRPEWGDGVVEQANLVQHEGKSAQRLLVRFVNRGLVTLNTGIAPLLHKDAASTMSSTSYSSAREKGWLGSLGRSSGSDELWRLPDAMTDPFLSIQKRLDATLDSYRFSTEPRSLIDWAIAQTGLSDPLSKYSRPELEQAFPRFARDRDNHLFDMVKSLKRQNQLPMLQQAAQAAKHPGGRSALQRAIKA